MQVNDKSLTFPQVTGSHFLQPVLYPPSNSAQSGRLPGPPERRQSLSEDLFDHVRDRPLWVALSARSRVPDWQVKVMVESGYAALAEPWWTSST